MKTFLCFYVISSSILFCYCMSCPFFNPICILQVIWVFRRKCKLQANFRCFYKIHVSSSFSNLIVCQQIVLICIKQSHSWKLSFAFIISNSAHNVQLKVNNVLRRINRPIAVKEDMIGNLIGCSNRLLRSFYFKF